jgi:hypothetical protein
MRPVGTGGPSITEIALRDYRISITVPIRTRGAQAPGSPQGDPGVLISRLFSSSYALGLFEPGPAWFALSLRGICMYHKGGLDPLSVP